MDLLQRIEGNSTKTSIQPAMEVGVGYHVNNKTSIGFNYFGSIPSSTLQDNGIRITGGALYNIASVSVRYEL